MRADILKGSGPPTPITPAMESLTDYDRLFSTDLYIRSRANHGAPAVDLVSIQRRFSVKVYVARTLCGFEVAEVRIFPLRFDFSVQH